MKKILSLILVTVMLLTLVPMAYAADNVKKGDIIEFGSYPQTEVTDKALIDKLNKQAPAWDKWTSYGYYSGEGAYGTMVSGSWMRYTDITLNGTKYRGVKFTQCRPHYTYMGALESYTDNGYRTNISYWFKFESLKWKVLDPETGLILCESVIDSQPYSNTVYYDKNAASDTFAYFNDDDYVTYTSDYATSSIRSWLNNDFLNSAFTSPEKTEIATTALNNDGYYTLTGWTDYKALDSKSTSDKIFLLSYNDVLNKDYGFNEYPDIETSSRRIRGTDYAECQGLWVSDVYKEGRSYWMLRTPGNKSSSVCYVNVEGRVFNTYSACHTVYGVRPALSLNSIEHQHDYKAVVTSPTCEDGGYTTYTCVCGYNYIGDRVTSVKHKDDNNDGMCDFNCGYDFNAQAEKKSFFERIIDWFRTLFDNIFGWMKK